MARLTSAADPVAMPGRWRRYARTTIAVLLGGGLCWQVGAAGLAGLAVRSADPRLLATMGSPRHPDAGGMWAQTLLAAGDVAKAAGVARSVVLADPTNDRAMRVLGLATERLGDRSGGARIMRQAAGLGWRDTPTQLWVLRDAALRDDAVPVIQRADALARRNRSTDMTRAVFLAAVNEPRLRAALADSLARRPIWRAAFFADVHQRLPAASTPGMEALFREMQARRLTVTPAEWLNYIDRLIDLHEYARARALWARVFAVPVARLAATPFDGNFAAVAARPDAAPASQFEWTIDPNLSGAVTFGGGPNGTALSIPANLSSNTVVLSQLLILAPGMHTLKAQSTGGVGTPAAGWSITCLPSGKDLLRRIPQGSDDALSQLSFDIPATGCPAQRLTLTTRELPQVQALSIESVQIR